MNDARPKKSLGQNYLRDPHAIDRIVQATLESPSQSLLEIGPGPGALTEKLCTDGRPLWVMELDPQHCKNLLTWRERYPHLHVLEGDACELPWPEGASFSVVGNLPYNAATPILTRILLSTLPWVQATLMFQKDVADKLLGQAHEKNYGPLSIILQLRTDVEILLTLPGTAFWPIPSVESSVILMKSHPRLSAEHAQSLLVLLHLSFAHRRKTLRNNWRHHPQEAEMVKALEALGLSPTLRAEALSPEQWLDWFHRVMQ